MNAVKTIIRESPEVSVCMSLAFENSLSISLSSAYCPVLNNRFCGSSKLHTNYGVWDFFGTNPFYVTIFTRTFLWLNECVCAVDLFVYPAHNMHTSTPYTWDHVSGLFRAHWSHRDAYTVSARTVCTFSLTWFEVKQCTYVTLLLAPHREQVPFHGGGQCSGHPLVCLLVYVCRVSS